MNMTLDNKLSYEERVQNLLNFEDDQEKIDFETEIIHIEIINQILQLMEKENISKSDLAKILGISKSYITQLFAGDKILNLKLLAKFQKIFKIKFKISFKSLENHEQNILFKNVSEDNFNINENNENKVINIKDYLPINEYICVNY